MICQKSILLLTITAFLMPLFSAYSLPSNQRIRRRSYQPTFRFKQFYHSPKNIPDVPSTGVGGKELSKMGDSADVSRRRALQRLMMATAVTVLPAEPAFGGKPEYDKETGQLFSPKGEMLSGGSAAARGTMLRSSAGPKLQPGQPLQTVYETRFITYLSRFLLTFDPATNAWWVQNTGSVDTWDLGSGSMNTFREGLTREEVDAKFAEFAESVEIGLADYFVGPYGSYGSVTAARAGLSASQQVRSSRPSTLESNHEQPPVLIGLFGNALENILAGTSKKEAKAKDRDAIAKQGILNLYTLLKARYTSVAAKRQLAILFSFFSNGDLQPTPEIQSLLGEADNATVSRIDFVRPYPENEVTSRTSSRRGGGYSIFDRPTVTVDTPPALGSFYSPAKAEAILEPTSRVLKIRVTDGGEGYIDTPPEVIVSSGDSQRVCTACAIVDREGRVESVFVIDPGYGYGKLQTRSRKPLEPPRVTIAAPPSGKGVKGRRAKAVAELEYEIVGINITSGGNGYVNTEPPKIGITDPKEDPDWFVQVPELKVLFSEFGPARAEVAEMRGPTGNLAYSIGDYPKTTKLTIERIRRDPTELLPSTVRPERNSLGEYVIPTIAAVPTYSSSLNQRYRAVDPLFGPIGSVPVTRSASELKPSEYGRLALSGAICTVLVRTALNPLELIKTKQQLKNDKELLDFAQNRVRLAGQVKNVKDEASLSDTATSIVSNPDATKELKIDSVGLILSLIELRGPLALFQSADITFLASLMFGSFGFGATELFRRSFTMVFFNEDGTGTNSEVILLLAAAVATVITSFFAAPFELLRVRSMGLVEQKKWTEVLSEFLDEKSSNGDDKPRRPNQENNPAQANDDETEFSLKDLNLQDLPPLWAGFPPTVSRELAFAIPKFLAFDVLAKAIAGFFNSQAGPGSLPIQVGVGTTGLAISAVAGAFAGIAGALVSHPADLILTYTSAAKKKTTGSEGAEDKSVDWRAVVKDLLSREGGVANLFVGLTPRLVFFFLVIGLQFFLYDYVKNLLNVGSDDLSLVLDVFYAIRQGLIDASSS